MHVTSAHTGAGSVWSVRSPRRKRRPLESSSSFHLLNPRRVHAARGGARGPPERTHAHRQATGEGGSVLGRAGGGLALGHRAEEHVAAARHVVRARRVAHAAARAFDFFFLEQALHGGDLEVLHVDDVHQQTLERLFAVKLRVDGSRVHLEQGLGHRDGVGVVRDHLAEEGGRHRRALRRDGHLLVHLAVDRLEALVEVVLRRLAVRLVAAEELLALAVRVLRCPWGVGTCVPRAAPLVEVGRVGGRRLGAAGD
mmetsp:Transcript_13325/g.43454  ORF Transcript_13325/g.43454 Transcript_13325/m.43454 type:complete len:254 (+) Transcript_13325:53-814(+)